MKTYNAIRSKWMRRAASLLITTVMTLGVAGQASARILFEDDLFMNIQSEGIILDANNNIASGGDITLQFGNTGSTDGTIKYDTSTNTLIIDTHGNAVDFSDDSLTTTGEIRFEGASHVRIREVAFAAYSGATAPQCNYVGEIALDTNTSAIYVCTVTGAPGGTWKSADNNPAAGTTNNSVLRWDSATGAWVESTQLLVDDAGNVITVVNGTTFTANGPVNLGDGGDSVSINSSTWDITSAGVASGFTGLTSTGNIDFSAATSLLLTQGAANPATCTEGAIFYNTTNNGTYICTAADTWTVLSSGNPDFETVYANDADNTLTTSNGNFSINLGSGIFNLIGTANINNNVNANTQINTGTSTGTVTIGNSLAGAVSITSGSNVSIAGNEVLFDDSKLLAAVQLTENATGWAAVLPSIGIIDNINAFTSTAIGEGASLVGIEDASGYFTGTNVEAALQEIGSQIGSNAPNVENLTFYAEYPDVVVYADGTNNRGTLQSLYDAVNSISYYNWTTNNPATQNIDIQFHIALPADFAATGDFTYQYRTGTVTEADNDVEIRLYNVTDGMQLCASDTTNVTAGAWATGTITGATIDTGCTGATALNAGDILLVNIKLIDRSGVATYADVGTLSLAYSN